jgi:heterodisulfide reductase subunit D
MSSAEVDFKILGGEEWCCGFPLIAAGKPDKAREMKEHNLETMKTAGVKSVVFSCPSCYRTWHEFYNTDLEIMHSTQILAKLIREGKIKLGPVNETVTYHDPCDLGRYAGIFEEPREILRAIPGLNFVEWPTRMKSICCGGGGNLEMADPELSAAVAPEKLVEIQNTGAKIGSLLARMRPPIQGQARKQKVDLTDKDNPKWSLSRRGPSASFSDSIALPWRRRGPSPAFCLRPFHG